MIEYHLWRCYIIAPAQGLLSFTTVPLLVFLNNIFNTFKKLTKLENHNTSSNIFQAFAQTCKNYPANHALYYKSDNVYPYIKYHQLYTHASHLGKFLIEKGIKKGDSVAIILDSSPAWPITFLAIMYAGAKAVPLCPQLDILNLHHFITHSECKYLIVSNSLYLKFKEFLKQEEIPLLAIDSLESIKEVPLSSKASFQIPKVQIDDPAAIIYTSGTTQVPKGVVLTHRNLLSNIISLKKLNIINRDDCLISVLPLYHAYPLMVNLLLPLLSGARISYTPHLEVNEILDCAKETKATILVAVPRLLSMLHQKIKDNLNKLPLLKKNLLTGALKHTPAFKKYLKINPAKGLLKDLHAGFGEKFRLIVSGGAKLDHKIALDLSRWGFDVIEGYGLTETSPVVTLNLPQTNKAKSVGQAIPGVTVEINEPDKAGIGEIIIKGENVFTGYLKQDHLTKEALKENWFYSGDLGYKSKSGFLYITGRKKEVLVLSSGKNVHPEEVEIHYLRSPFIDEMCVFLSKDENLSAVILPNYTHFRQHQVVQTRDRMRWEIEKLSRLIPSYMRVKKYKIINKKLPRTILGKIKRHEIENIYSEFENEPPTQKSIPVPEDTEILSSAICKKALDYLSEQLKKHVRLDDNIELDLGLDSLEQISLFLEFEKVTGMQIQEEELIGILTVRDLLKSLKEASESQTEERRSMNWQEILKAPISPDIEKTISIKSTLFSKLFTFLVTGSFKIFCRIFFLLEVKGKKNIPKKGPFIICPTHASYLDGMFISSALSFSTLFDTFFLGYAAYFKHPLVSWASKFLRLISIDPASSLVDSLKSCSFILHKHKILCLFPEGIRSITGEVGEFKRGVGILIKELYTTAIPIYIDGAYKAWPPHRILPRPRKIKVLIGKPLNLEELISDTDSSIDIYKNIIDNLREAVLDLEKISQSKKI